MINYENSVYNRIAGRKRLVNIRWMQLFFGRLHYSYLFNFLVYFIKSIPPRFGIRSFFGGLGGVILTFAPPVATASVVIMTIVPVLAIPNVNLWEILAMTIFGVPDLPYRCSLEYMHLFCREQQKCLPGLLLA